MMALPGDICSDIRASLEASGLFSSGNKVNGGAPSWRISPEPFWLSQDDYRFFIELGDHLLKFYTALNQMYLDSVKGRVPSWVAEYLDAGKPPDLVQLGRMKRFKRDVPGIIRPDVIVTESGFVVTELDSVPGGFGLTSGLMSLYRENGGVLASEEEGGIPALFYQMLEELAQNSKCTVGIVVSEEARDYLGEMKFLVNHLNDKGFPIHVLSPRELIFREEGLFVEEGGREIPLEVIYRFFELFDLPNIPKSELMLYAFKKGLAVVTPPCKPWLEEKLAFALFHHPALKTIWENALGSETFNVLSHLIPKTWILDNRPLPPQAVIPGLVVRGKSVRDWSELLSLTQKERELVIKPSGFSPEAWGSRGVVVGHDVSSEDWGKTLQESLHRFPRQPSILQEFHKGKRIRISYENPASGSLVEMESRVRLTPYYFPVGGKAKLGGILATLCPQDKKKIHGMTDAVMIPCAVRDPVSLDSSL